MPPGLLVLREEAQVMLIKNTDENLVNGSMGRVVRFVDPAVYMTEADEQGGEAGVIGGGTEEKKASAVVGTKLYPVVEFLLPSGRTKTTLVLPETWKVELLNGETQISRTQVISSPFAVFHCEI